MKKSLIVFARCVSISATVLASQLAAAQVVDAGNTATAPKDATTQQPQTQQETQAPISTTSTLTSSNIFSSSSSANQQSFTPSYELGNAQAGAGQGGVMTAPAKGAPIVNGGLYLYLDANLTMGSNSNVIGSSTNAISSSLYSLQPEMVAEVKNHGDRYTASYLGNYTRYTSDSADDFTHHEFKLAGDDIFDARTRLGWLVGYTDSSDPRGATNRTISAEPDQWHAPTAATLFSYGALDSMGRIELDASVFNKTYTNNRATTIGSDVDISTVSGRFFYRVAPKTSLLLELKEIKSDYDLTDSPNSNTDRRIMVGATWTATAATTGSFKIGYSDKVFDAPGSVNYSGIAWEGQVRWMPLTYSTVDFLTSKSAADSTGLGDYVVNQNYSATWTHRWSNIVATHANLGLLKSNYVGADRQDNLRNIGVGVTYDLRRWLRLGAEVANTNLDSSVSDNNFKRNVVLFSLQGTL